MNNYDWSRFDIYIYIEASPQALFNRWSTASGLESFFMKQVTYKSSNGKERPKEECIEPGDTYTWEFIHRSVLQGKIIDVKAERQVTFTFGDDSVVDVLFKKSNKRTLIHLCQRNIPITEEAKVHIHLNCHGAWIHFLTVLKSVSEFGIDCRDKHSATSGSFATQFHPAEY